MRVIQVRVGALLLLAAISLAPGSAPPLSRPRRGGINDGQVYGRHTEQPEPGTARLASSTRKTRRDSGSHSLATSDHPGGDFGDLSKRRPSRRAGQD